MIAFVVIVFWLILANAIGYLTFDAILFACVAWCFLAILFDLFDIP